jgi:hypothetical protein
MSELLIALEQVQKKTWWWDQMTPKETVEDKLKRTAEARDNIRAAIAAAGRPLTMDELVQHANMSMVALRPMLARMVHRGELVRTQREKFNRRRGESGFEWDLPK